MAVSPFSAWAEIGERSNPLPCIEKIAMSLPTFQPSGDLPVGVYPATLSEVRQRFGHGSPSRLHNMLRLERIYQIAANTHHLARFIVFGSFVTNKESPGDVDIFMLMEDTFEKDSLVGEAHILFEHGQAQDYFGASVFWLRRMAAFGGEEAAVSDWQWKRDGSKRGVIEIIEETT